MHVLVIIHDSGENMTKLVLHYVILSAYATVVVYLKEIQKSLKFEIFYFQIKCKCTFIYELYNILFLYTYTMKMYVNIAVKYEKNTS